MKTIIGCNHNIQRKIDYPKMFKRFEKDKITGKFKKQMRLEEGTRIFLICSLGCPELSILIKEDEKE